MRRWKFWLLLLLPIPCWADATAAFNDGKNLGNAVNSQNLGAISAGSIQDKLPAYGQSVAETGYFQGGHGDTIGPGAGKVSLCSTATPDSDPIRRQECDAVNFLARNPDIRPQFTITSNDPMILGARTARNSAEAVFQSSGISGGMGSNSQCVTRTETTPAQTTTETCSSIRELTTEQCTMGRIINIDSDANFQCDATYKAMESLTCRRRANVTVTTTTSTSPCSGGKATVNGDYRDAAHASLSCTGTTGVYSVSYWSTFNNCNCSASGSVSAGGGTASIRCNNGCGWTQGVNHSVSCSGASCTWSVTFYSGNNSAGSRSAAFTGSSTSSSTSTSVSWDNSACATLSQRSQ